MTYKDIQSEVIAKYRITINEHSECRTRTHAHIKKRMVCKWSPKNSFRSLGIASKHMKEVGTSLALYPSFFVFAFAVSESIRNFAPIPVMVSVVRSGMSVSEASRPILFIFRDYSVTRRITIKPLSSHYRAFAVIGIHYRV